MEQQELEQKIIQLELRVNELSNIIMKTAELVSTRMAALTVAFEAHSHLRDENQHIGQVKLPEDTLKMYQELLPGGSL